MDDEVSNKKEAEEALPKPNRVKVQCAGCDGMVYLHEAASGGEPWKFYHQACFAEQVKLSEEGIKAIEEEQEKGR
jgi:hypothetical protein